MTAQGICPECQSRQQTFLLFGDWVLIDHPPAGGACPGCEDGRCRGCRQRCKGSGMEPRAVVTVGVPVQEGKKDAPHQRRWAKEA